jgi:hypothetical protein
MLRGLIRLKLAVLIGLWTALCLTLVLFVALVEGAAELAGGAAGALVGQGALGIGLVDSFGDLVQAGLGLLWLAGTITLWLVKQRFARSSATSRPRPAGPPGPALSRRPEDRAARLAASPGVKLLAGIISRKSGRR